MMGFLLGLLVGLVVGWNFLKQPDFVKRWMDRLLGRDEDEE